VTLAPGFAPGKIWNPALALLSRISGSNSGRFAGGTVRLSDSIYILFRIWRNKVKVDDGGKRERKEVVERERGRAVIQCAS
jgi:hypothetical protein